MAITRQSPSELDIVNGVLALWGQKPVTAVTDNEKSITIQNKLSLYHDTLLKKEFWNFATQFKFDNTPLTNNPFGNFLFNYLLPSDYGRFWRFSDQMTPQFGLVYQILDGILQTNAQPVQYFYIVKNVPYYLISSPYQLALEYYVAYILCVQFTNNINLKASLKNDFENEFLPAAILQSKYEQAIVQTPFNDFDRQAYI